MDFKDGNLHVNCCVYRKIKKNKKKKEKSMPFDSTVENSAALGKNGQ